MVDSAVQGIWSAPPHCFEAGTPTIEGVLGLSASIEFIQKHFNFADIQKYEENLLHQAESCLKKIPKVRIIGESPSRINTLSFIVEGVHSDDLGQIIGTQKVAVRSGHHCCQPLMDRLNLESGTVRASFSVYNKEEDVFALEKSLKKALSILSSS